MELLWIAKLFVDLIIHKLTHFTVWCSPFVGVQRNCRSTALVWISLGKDNITWCGGGGLEGRFMVNTSIQIKLNDQRALLYR